MRLPESIVYMTLCNSPGLQRVHISAKQIFHAPIHPSNKKFCISQILGDTRPAFTRVFPKRALGKSLGTRLLFCKMITLHRASVVTSWKNNYCLESLEWPAQSPDVNPIEHLRMVLKKAISKRYPPPKLFVTCKL